MRLSELKQKTAKAAAANPFYISLADLMMLLCVFFVLIIGMSKIDVGSFERLRTGITGEVKGTLVELARDLAQAAQGQDGVSVRLADDGVRIDLQSAAFFDTASAVLKPQALDPLAPILARIRLTSYSIDVEGHSDDRDYFRRQGDEIETNWSLSGRRAASVVNYLKDNGFGENRLRIVGYASNKPQVATTGLNDQQLEEARAKNRRVSLLVR